MEGSSNDGASFRTANAASQPNQQIQPSQAFRQASDAVLCVQRESQQYEQIAKKLIHKVHELQRAVELTQAAYQSVVAEKDHFQHLLGSAEGRLAEVQRVVQRYTIVQDPVVASDGYTYERRVIHQYLNECTQSGVTPISQQTQSELNSTLIPNQSLKKLVELLKTARPAEVPPPDVAKDTAKPAAGGNGNDQRMHPCVRVYGYCNYKEGCTYAPYPYDACLSHLKGKCRFGNQCHELHVDFRGSAGGQQQSRKKE